MRDFFEFRRMFTPVMVQITFWLFTAASVIGGLIVLVRANDADYRRVVAPLDPVAVGIVLILLVPIALRLWAETTVVIFSIDHSLYDIRLLTGSSPGAPIAPQSV